MIKNKLKELKDKLKKWLVNILDKDHIEGFGWPDDKKEKAVEEHKCIMRNVITGKLASSDCPICRKYGV